MNENLSLKTESSKSDIKYEFKSVVCHYGENVNNGYYVAMVKTGNQYMYEGCPEST